MDKKGQRGIAFVPKKPVRTFRDLEVYQKTLECAVIIAKDIADDLEAALDQFGTIVDDLKPLVQ